MPKFHNYVYGRKLILYTDHQPLKQIFGHGKQYTYIAAGRLQRWCIFLSMYDFEIRCKKGSPMGNADALTRIQLTDPTYIENNCLHFISITGDMPFEFLNTHYSIRCCKLFSVLSVMDGRKKILIPDGKNVSNYQS